MKVMDTGDSSKGNDHVIHYEYKALKETRTDPI
jgi:hypothetical protein